jgi:hypothetical protein
MILWFICSIKVFLDLDMLKAPQGMAGMRTFGNQRRPSSAYDLHHQVNATRENVTYPYHIHLTDFRYENNVIDWL